MATFRSKRIMDKKHEIDKHIKTVFNISGITSKYSVDDFINDYCGGVEDPTFYEMNRMQIVARLTQKIRSLLPKPESNVVALPKEQIEAAKSVQIAEVTNEIEELEKSIGEKPVEEEVKTEPKKRTRKKRTINEKVD